MLIAKNDEKERSHLFRIVIWTASIVIIVIAAYFLIRMFGANPVAGTWEYQDDNITMKIKDKDRLTVSFANLQDMKDLEVSLDYEVEKSEKTLTIAAPKEKEISDIVKESDGRITEAVLDTALSRFTASFDYSIEQQRLTLTDREYGEQMVFDRK